jgi:FixJ family two-component response regulator
MESERGKSVMQHPLISAVDDDESVRESLPDLLREFGFTAHAFSSAQEFLSSERLNST